MFPTDALSLKGQRGPRGRLLQILRGCAALVVCACTLGVASATPGTAPQAGGTGAAQVTLPLPDYEKLVNKPAVTVIDALRIGGSFAGRDLTVTLIGRASGFLPKVEVLGGPAGVRLYGCDGDAILSRSDAGPFELTPLQPKFTLRCRVAMAGSDRLQLDSAPSVLWVESQVTDGELVSYEEARDNSGRRSFSVVRASGNNADVIKPTATARYRVTLEPEGTQFAYQLEVRNPNRSHQPFLVHLSSGELVQEVDTPASYEPSGSDYKFLLPPGDMTIKLVGTLKQPSFTPPVAASVQYFLLESHPLLRPNLTTAAKRISASETGLVPRFRGAQGFLLGDKDALAWQVMRLEALRTTSFAVNQARHTLFLSSDAVALGESEIALDNQGAPALSLPMQAEPTYASIQHEPSFLTKSEAGTLWLPLGQGSQSVLVQYRQPFERFVGFASATLPLPVLKVPASSALIELRYSHDWVPLYESFAPEVRLPLLDGSEVFLFVLLLLLTERALSLLRLGLRVRIALALLFSAASLTSAYWLSILCIADLVLAGLWVVPWLLRRKWGFWSTIAALCVGGFVCLIGGSLLLVSAPRSAPAVAPTSVSYERKSLLREEPVSGGKRARDDQTTPSPGGGGAQAYQGLPAKFVMPAGAAQSFYSREMLATEPARTVQVIALSRAAIGVLGSALFVLGLLVLLLQRQRLRAGLAEILQRSRKPSSGA